MLDIEDERCAADSICQRTIGNRLMYDPWRPGDHASLLGASAVCL